MNKKIAIIGAGGHGKVVGEIALLNKYNPVHFFDDQIRVIKTAIYSLKKGGTLIIEDVFINTDHRTGKVHSKDEYEKHLNNDIFKNFKKVYLVTLNHINKRSPGWNNDRLLVFENKL